MNFQTIDPVTSATGHIFKDHSPVEEKDEAPRVVAAYHADTIAPAHDSVELKLTYSDLDKKGRPLQLDEHLSVISSDVDEMLKSNKIDFEKLQVLVYKVVMMHMRKSAKVSQEQMADMRVKIRVQAVNIQKSYNSYYGRILTVISATISIAGGLSGLAPLAAAAYPAMGLSAVTAQSMNTASQSIAMSGTALDNVGRTFFTNAEEGKRSVIQSEKQELEVARDGKKEAKGAETQRQNSAREALKEGLEAVHRAIMSALGG